MPCCRSARLEDLRQKISHKIAFLKITIRLFCQFQDTALFLVASFLSATTQPDSPPMIALVTLGTVLPLYSRWVSTFRKKPFRTSKVIKSGPAGWKRLIHSEKSCFFFCCIPRRNGRLVNAFVYFWGRGGRDFINCFNLFFCGVKPG